MHAHMRAGEEQGRCLASERSDSGLVGNEVPVIHSCIRGGMNKEVVLYIVVAKIVVNSNHHNWGERERAPPLMKVNGSRVRPRTSRRLRMRDIHVIYADSNSADVMTLLVKNRLLLKWSQCKHSKKGTVRRDWNDVDSRNGRDVLEKRQRRETEGAVFETRGTGKEDGLDVLRDVLLRLHSLSAYVHV